MQYRKRRSLPDEDRRLVLISVRLTERENEVVEQLCRTYRCSRSQLLRMMYTLSMPPALPALNVQAFGLLDRMAFQLSELGDGERWADGPLAERLAAVETALDHLRDALIGAGA